MASATLEHAEPRPGAWLVSPRFDTLLFFAPALLAVTPFLLALVFGVSPLVFLWIWLLGFDGPHMAAAYARTYGDARMRRERPGLLLGSLSALAVGPAILAIGALLGTKQPFLAFLALMSVYGVHHVVRQHWGFVAIYGARGRVGRSSIDRVVFYAGCWAPYVYFLVTHPAIRALAELPAPPGLLARGIATGAIAIWAVATAVCALGLLRALRSRAGIEKSLYFTVVLVFHGLLYGWLARFEPVYGAANGTDQVFMLLGVAAGSFHSAQYIALVGLVRSRLDRSRDARVTLRKSALGYLAGCFGFSALYLGFACATGVYPGCQALLGTALFRGITANELALALWNGIALHHYFLDERVWRIRQDPELATALGLRAA